MYQGTGFRDQGEGVRVELSWIVLDCLGLYELYGFWRIYE